MSFMSADDARRLIDSAPEMGSNDRSVVETVLDYVEQDNIEVARSYVDSLSRDGLRRAIRNLQVASMLMTTHLVTGEMRIKEGGNAGQ